jgi:hypothetical protein
MSPQEENTLTHKRLSHFKASNCHWKPHRIELPHCTHPATCPVDAVTRPLTEGNYSQAPKSTSSFPIYIPMFRSVW